MYISYVEISNFRALQQISIPLNQFSVLIGENDVGKTSFLYALDKFFIGKKLSEKKDWFKKETDDDIRIVLTFKDIPEDDELVELLRDDDSIVLSKVFSYERPPVVTSILDDNSAKNVPAALQKKWFSTDSFHFIPVRRDLAIQFSMNKTAMLGKTLRAKMKHILEEGGGSDSLNELQTTLSNAIEEPQNILQNYLREQMHDNSVSLEFADLEIDPIEGVSFNTILSDDRVEDVLIEDRGAGTQNNLIIALFRLIADLELSGYFIFAMEEPENSLHPKAQRQLLSVIQDISRQSQVIITTHSPVFIDRSQYENNILLTRTTNGNTVAKIFNPEIIGDIRTDLGIKSSDALLKGGGNCAILVEGNTEEDGFPVFMEMMGLSEFQLGIAIINMQGSDFQTARKIIQLLLAYDIPCVVVLDNDAQQCEQDLNRCIENLLTNLKRVFRLTKGTIEDYYPLDVIAEIINNKLSPNNEITVDHFDQTKHGQERLLDFKKVMHENGSGDSIEYLKSLIGGIGTKILQERELDVDEELQDIFKLVQDIVNDQ